MKRIYLNSLSFMLILIIYILLGTFAMISYGEQLKLHQVIIIIVGYFVILLAIVISINQVIIIDKNKELIIFKFGFSKNEVYQRSLKLIKKIQVYVADFSICFEIDYGEFSETIKHRISSRGIGSMSRRSKRIEEKIEKELIYEH